jgi:hypothetical protein
MWRRGKKDGRKKGKEGSESSKDSLAGSME